MKTHVVRAPGTDRYRLPVPTKLSEVTETPTLLVRKVFTGITGTPVPVSWGGSSVIYNSVPDSFDPASATANKWRPRLRGLYQLSAHMPVQVTSGAADTATFGSGIIPTGGVIADQLNLELVCDSTVTSDFIGQASCLMPLDTDDATDGWTPWLFPSLPLFNTTVWQVTLVTGIICVAPIA